MRVPYNETTFSSDTRPYYLATLKICTGLGLLLVLAAIIGQFRADRFPAYFDIFVVLMITSSCYLVVIAAIFLGARLFKIFVSPNYLYCYTATTRYRLVSWFEIHDVVPVVVYGMPYLYIYAYGSPVPITLPVWLSEMDQFRKLVEKYAGEDHLLSHALRTVAT